MSENSSETKKNIAHGIIQVLNRMSFLKISMWTVLGKTEENQRQGGKNVTAKQKRRGGS